MPDATPSTTPIPISTRLFFILGGVIPAILVALDQLSKWATVRLFGQRMDFCENTPKNLSWEDVDHEILNLVDIHLVCNPGISWGMWQGDSPIKRWVLTAFAFIMTFVLLYVLRKTQDRLGQISLSFVIAGAVGNAIDRLLFGAVTDMIDFGDIGFRFVFNVADSYITVGVIGLFLSSYLTEKRAKAAAKMSVD